MKGALLALFLASGAQAAETAAFLKISPGARPVGMGNAFTAVADDLSGLAWNPAGLALMVKREAAFQHAELYQDTSYDFIGYAHPLASGLGTAAFGFARLSHGGLEGRDAAGTPTGSFEASDMAVTGSFSHSFGAFRGGLSLKFLQSTIAGTSAKTGAVDLGIQRSLPVAGKKLSFGAALLNIGPGMKFLATTEPLPLTASFGAAAAILPGMNFTADYRVRPHSGKTEWGFGAEVSVLSALILRGGYASQFAQAVTGSGGLGAMAMGLGFKMGPSRLDYAFTPAGELGNAQRVSLSAAF